MVVLGGGAVSHERGTPVQARDEKRGRARGVAGFQEGGLGFRVWGAGVRVYLRTTTSQKCAAVPRRARI